MIRAGLGVEDIAKRNDYRDVGTVTDHSAAAFEEVRSNNVIVAEHDDVSSRGRGKTSVPIPDGADVDALSEDGQSRVRVLSEHVCCSVV